VQHTKIMMPSGEDHRPDGSRGHKADQEEGSENEPNDHLARDKKRAAKEKRRRKREARLVKRLAALGLDEHGDELDHYSLQTYPVREWKFTLPGFSDPVALNPVVSLIGLVFIWGVVGWCAGE
jgi:hypothetical protein